MERDTVRPVAYQDHLEDGWVVDPSGVREPVISKTEIAKEVVIVKAEKPKETSEFYGVVAFPSAKVDVVVKEEDEKPVSAPIKRKKKITKKMSKPIKD